MSVQQFPDDHDVRSDDDDERQDGDQCQREPRSYLVLEIAVRLGSAADPLHPTGLRVVVDVASPEDVDVLHDGERDDATGDEGGSSGRAHDVLQQRTAHGYETIQREDDQDPDRSVARCVDGELFQLARPSARGLKTDAAAVHTSTEHRRDRRTRAILH